MQRPWFSSLAIFATCIFTTSYAFAAHPAATDDAGTVEPRVFEVEFSSDQARESGSRCSGYGVALRHGLLDRVDAGVAVGCLMLQGADASFGYGLDAKVRILDDRGWRPATFVRLDASTEEVDGGHESHWDGFALGSTWATNVREVSIEAVGIADDVTGDAVDLGAVWVESVGVSWALVGEFTTQVSGNAPREQSALLGIVREFDGFGAISLGVRTDTRDPWTQDSINVTVGFTREVALAR